MKIEGTSNQAIPVQSEGIHEGGKPAVVKKQDDKLWKACQNFEALFMGYLVSSMERTLPEGSLSGNGISNMMFNQVMGSTLSEGGGIGLAEIIYRDLQSKHIQGASEKEDVTSLQDLLTRPVRKEDHDEKPSR